MKITKNKPLWGVSFSGFIKTPNGYIALWLPRKLAYRLHKLLNQ